MKAKMANCGASVKPNRKARMYGGGMAKKKMDMYGGGMVSSHNKKKKKSMSANVGGMPMKMKKKEDMGMARGTKVC